MIYQIDFTEPGYFWAMRKLEVKKFRPNLWTCVKLVVKKK